MDCCLRLVQFAAAPLRRSGQPMAAHRLAQRREIGLSAQSPDLIAAMRDFELTYAAYAEFQHWHGRYWCLRWLRQAGSPSMSARVLRESLVRLEDPPLVFKVPSMPTLPPGTRVQLAIDSTDLIDLEVRATYLRNPRRRGQPPRRNRWRRRIRRRRPARNRARRGAGRQRSPPSAAA